LLQNLQKLHQESDHQTQETKQRPSRNFPLTTGALSAFVSKLLIRVNGVDASGARVVASLSCDKNSAIFDKDSIAEER